MKLVFFATILFVLQFNNKGSAQQMSYSVNSPDKKITVHFFVTVAKQVLYNVTYNNAIVLENSKLGLIRDDADFSNDLEFKSASAIALVKDNYTLKNGKKSNCVYVANKQVFHLTKNPGNRLDIIFQVSNDGVAFRYYFPDQSASIKKIIQEITSFNFADSSKAWLQPMDEAKSGWAQTNPAYEEHHHQAMAVGTVSPNKAGWVFPALFQSGNTWLLLTETAPDKNYCASRLQSQSPEGEYSIGFPDAREVFTGGNANPESSLPWFTPWRIIVIGSLQTITESTLGTDLAKPVSNLNFSFVKPGKSAWSWALGKDNSVEFKTQKKYIDYAADMHWQYSLIDAFWDKQIGYDSIKILSDYAASKNVGLWLWYNSSGDWNTTKQTPKSKLLTHDDRVKEFTKLKEMGIKGIKVDFFGGDGQSMMDYYVDLFEDAAKFGLMINCHGATLPRGWQRTYPNLMSMEAIRGFEMISFNQKDADAEATHCAMQPFTRNAFDPMDFTPMCFYKIPRIIRKTTCAFELELSVVFTSGIQHFAESVEGMSHAPSYVKEFLQQIPDYWQESKLIDGYPGKLVVMARKFGNKWYVAAINGENIDKNLKLDLSFLKNKTGTLITDGDGKETVSFDQKIINVSANGKTTLSIKGNGGFVAVFE